MIKIMVHVWVCPEQLVQYKFCSKIYNLLQYLLIYYKVLIDQSKVEVLILEYLIFIYVNCISLLTLSCIIVKTG